MRDEHKNGGPAFPAEWDYIGSNREVANGISARDYFAAKALPGVMQMVSDGTHQQSVVDLPIQQVDFIAKSAYDIADAMLKARTA